MPANDRAKKITSWSFSRYSLHKQCPFKAKLSIINKMKEPPNAAMERGARMHDDAEHYIKGTLKVLPADLKPAKAELDMVKKLYAKRIGLSMKGMAPVVEDSWAFTKDWTTTTWNDWTYCVLRVKLDVAWWETPSRLRIRDWKSGKYNESNREEYQEQLDLYALAALLVFPQLEEVLPDLYYIDAGISYPPEESMKVYTRDAIDSLKKAWAKRTRPMLNDLKFPPRPGWYCTGCYFNKSTSYGWGTNKKEKPAGPCKY